MSVEVITFGCRLNAFESEVIAREAANAGLDQTIVINSCAVTNEAVAQARQHSHKTINTTFIQSPAVLLVTLDQIQKPTSTIKARSTRTFRSRNGATTGSSSISTQS